MTRAEREALLGKAVLQRVEAEADAAIAEYPPAPEVLDRLRPVLSRPANRPAARAA
ncbi:hypothetical protein [Streptomyces misionensis]|uniref:hypothetical protein n=1 Tax=Streptomyces misionensis TaxID=67331 RepID=UPI00367DD0E3